MPPFRRGHSSSWPDLLFIQETAVAEKPCLILTVRDCSVLARMLRAESGLTGAERSRVRVESGFWLLPHPAPSCWCSPELLLPLSCCVPLFSWHGSHSQMWVTLCWKTQYGKDWGGTQRGWLLAPHAFSVSLFLWSCFLLVVTKC